MRFQFPISAMTLAFKAGYSYHYYLHKLANPDMPSLSLYKLTMRVFSQISTYQKLI